MKHYCCPLTGETLTLKSNALVSESGLTYPIEDGIPDLVYPRELTKSLAETVKLYEDRAEVYDRYLPLTFHTFDEDEDAIRQAMVDKLRLQKNSRVLEVGGGSGRDSVNIVQRLGKSGALHMLDVSPSMLKQSVEKLQDAKCEVHLALANGEYLPFADNFFDAAFNFGSMGEFQDPARAFSELARVVKPGGKVVVGDENMPVWLRGRTEFATILMNHNPQFAFDLPLKHLPIEARKVKLEWIIGGVFYLLEFEVGEGEPHGNFDFPIPGARGGTHRTRYLGQLEGVSLETKILAQEARAASGKSMHDWLDEVVKKAAEETLKTKK